MSLLAAVAGRRLVRHLRRRYGRRCGREETVVYGSSADPEVVEHAEAALAGY